MPIDRALENNWDRQLSDGLPDARLNTREKKRIYRANMWWEPVFCSSCSKGPVGLVTADWSPHVFYICDDCAKAHGPPPGAIEAPAEHVAANTKPTN